MRLLLHSLQILILLLLMIVSPLVLVLYKLLLFLHEFISRLFARFAIGSLLVATIFVRNHGREGAVLHGLLLLLFIVDVVSLVLQLNPINILLGKPVLNFLILLLQRFLIVLVSLVL